MSLFSGLLGGVSNLVGGIFGRASSISDQQRQNRYNVQFWNMQNEYNKPINQMRRLREAGVNPNLAFGSGANTSAHMVQSADRGRSSETLGESVGSAMSNFLNARQQSVNIRNSIMSQNNQNKITDAEVKLKLAQIEQTMQSTKNLRINSRFIGTNPVQYGVRWFDNMISNPNGLVGKYLQQLTFEKVKSDLKRAIQFGSKYSKFFKFY